MKLIDIIKTRIIQWAFQKMIEKFVTNDNSELIEIHLKTGYIIYTGKDMIKSEIENLIDRNRI